MIASIIVFLLLSASLCACFVYLQHRIDELDAAVTDMRSRVTHALKNVSSVTGALSDLSVLAKSQADAASKNGGPSETSIGQATADAGTAAGALAQPIRDTLDDYKAFFATLARRVDGVELRLLPFDRFLTEARDREAATNARVAKLEDQLARLSSRVEAADVVAARTLRVRGGISDGDREGKLPTEFASEQDGRNHIRGDTEIMGDLMILGGHSRFCVGGRCYDARQLRNALDNAVADACDASWSALSPACA